MIIDENDDPSMPQPPPNLHHLELFYHVATAGGITAATRSMPYGIQQPAVSGQISSLEHELGVRLFQRRPFKLTPAGQELFDFIAPFFGRLPDVAQRIAGKASRHLRLAAPATVIREHLPEVISGIRKSRPDLELTLVDAGQRRIFELLEREEIDLAIAELESGLPSGIHSEILAELPLILLTPARFKFPAGGLAALVSSASLIRPPADTAVSRLFHRGLTAHGLHWPSRIEISTIDQVEAYVLRGFGVGLTVRIPGISFPKSLKATELRDFPKLAIAGLWRGKPHPLASQVLAGLREVAAITLSHRAAS